ncbi:MAG TPA: hypothetical protein VNU71_14640 [Burkholderiaceae bacterium]|nr:hypothetical protein [Burkholderiaceae bacterium]
MSGLFGYDLGDLSSNFDAALSFGSDPSFDTARTAATQTSDAIQSSQPVTSDNGGSWTGFWQNTLGSIVGYAAAKDVAQTRVQNTTAAAQQAAMAGRSNNGLLLIVAAVVGVVLLTRG